MDGEMHEIGDNVPPRERFVIPRDNIPNRRRKQLRDQFMRRTRLVLKEAVRTDTRFAVRNFFGVRVVGDVPVAPLSFAPCEMLMGVRLWI